MANKRSYTQPVGMVGFIQSIKNFFTGYADFTGTSTRAEYWWVWLAGVGLSMTLWIFGAITILALGNIGITIFTIFYWTICALLILPGAALITRRFHDVGLSGWWFFGPILGCIVMMAFTPALKYVLPMEIVIVPMFLALLAMFAWYIFVFTVTLLPSKLQNNPYRK